VRLAPGCATAALVALSVVAPDTLSLGDLAPPAPAPLMAAAALQLSLGILRRSAWHAVLGGIAFAAALTLTVPGEEILVPWRGALLFHLGLLAVFVVGA